MELDALREQMALDAEIERLRIAMRLTEEASDKVGVLDFMTSYKDRIEYAQLERSKPSAYLASAGWNLPDAELGPEGEGIASDAAADDVVLRKPLP